MSKNKGHHAEPICHPDGRIDFAVRSPEGEVVCTTLGLIQGDAIAAITDAYNRAKLIAVALNAQPEGGQP